MHSFLSTIGAAFTRFFRTPYTFFGMAVFSMFIVSLPSVVPLLGLWLQYSLFCAFIAASFVLFEYSCEWFERKDFGPLILLRVAGKILSKGGWRIFLKIGGISFLFNILLLLFIVLTFFSTNFLLTESGEDPENPSLTALFFIFTHFGLAFIFQTFAFLVSAVFVKIVDFIGPEGSFFSKFFLAFRTSLSKTPSFIFFIALFFVFYMILGFLLSKATVSVVEILGRPSEEIAQWAASSYVLCGIAFFAHIFSALPFYVRWAFPQFFESLATVDEIECDLESELSGLSARERRTARRKKERAHERLEKKGRE